MDPHVLRRRFLDFFAERDHAVVASSPVVPKSDPTLLFTNAGMNQFKDVFLGFEVRDYRRAASAQKCVRAGGKHNDLDEVGKDGRHLTFFEMLGNWSFGDYYKADSIAWGWKFLLEEMRLDPERLFVTVHTGDDESWAIWRDQVGVPEARMMRLGNPAVGDEENFWSMGPTGPCGPCTEIHYDTHPEQASCWGPDYDGERYVELWNHVFMEFDRSADGTLTPLPMKSVDTGMGLERASAVMAGVDSVYTTRLFKGILEKTARLLGLDLSQTEILARPDMVAFRVIADHVRTLTFAISEGQPFSNEGRGYVLRRILRRAVRFGRGLGFEGPFLWQVAQAVVADFGDAYPEIVPVAAQAQEVLRLEEERFFRTIDRGIARFVDMAQRSGNRAVIAGRDAFQLYDTFGFPLDLTQIMAEERGMSVDTAGFEEALAEQRARSAEASRFYTAEEAGPWVSVCAGDGGTFIGYARDETASRITRYRARGDYYELLLDITPFYAESGGQVGDTGTIVAEDGSLRFRVVDTQRSDSLIVHLCSLEDGFVTEETMQRDVIAAVDGELRWLTASNHTATHLLHAALRSVVSADIHQAGSLVRHDKLRFDFTHPRALTAAQLDAIEELINAQIREGHAVRKHSNIPRESAEQWGAMAIFGEKYGDTVRVIEVPGVSMELCGGLHVDNLRDILAFRVTQESAIAAGTRRVEAVTNAGAFELAKRDRRLLQETMRAARAERAEVLPERLERLQEERAELERYADSLAQRLASIEVRQILARGRDANGVQVCSARIAVRDRKQLLLYADMLRDRIGEGVALLGALIEDKPALVCLVSDGILKQYSLKAGDLVNVAAAIVGGRGGGRPTLAQAGGVDPGKLDEAITAFYPEVLSRLSQQAS